MTPAREVEKVAKRMQSYVIRCALKRHPENPVALWEQLNASQKWHWLLVARWHLAALAKARKQTKKISAREAKL